MQPIQYRQAGNFEIVINPKLRLDAAAQTAYIKQLFYNTIGERYEELDADIYQQLDKP